MNRPEFLNTPLAAPSAAVPAHSLLVYKKYRSRMITTHLKRYRPDAEHEKNSQRLRGRMVPFGQGVVKMPALIQSTRRSSPAA